MKLAKEYTITDPSQLSALAREIRARFSDGATIGLVGDLGAGKTAFSRVFIEQLIEEGGHRARRVMSPTFPIHLSYRDLTPPVEHFDLYRLDSADESALDGIGYFPAQAEARGAGGFVLVEWPERSTAQLLGLDAEIRITIGDPETTRIYALLMP